MEKRTMEAIYTAAKSVYDGEERLSDARKKINADFKVNENSFSDYYRALEKMLDGGLHSRIISSGLRDYFLSKIYETYGRERLKIALDSYLRSIQYYERTHQDRPLRKEREIYLKYCKILQSV